MRLQLLDGGPPIDYGNPLLRYNSIVSESSNNRLTHEKSLSSVQPEVLAGTMIRVRIGRRYSGTVETLR